VKSVCTNGGIILKAEHLQTKQIKVAGHLADVRGIYQMKMSWYDPSGERMRKSVSTGLPVKGNKKRAEDMLKDACRDMEERLSRTGNANELLFADFMEQWLEAIRPEIKPTTFGGYQLNVQKAIVPYFRKSGILLCNLTAEDINTFYEAQLLRVKAMTVHKFHANISKALKYAVKKGLLPHSIMDKVERPRPERFVGKFLKQSEVVDLFEAVKGNRLELGVILGAFYGLRRAEIVGLRWESIDFEANTITIEHTVTEAKIDGQRFLFADDTTKTKASNRTLPLVPSFRAKLLEIKAEQERYRKLCGKSYNKAEAQYIYTDVLGNRIKPSYLTGMFPEFMVKHGFRRLRFHDLRHSCASLLLANGVPLKQIQEWLGHSDFAITANTYAHLEFNSKLAAAQAMTWLGKTTMGQVEANTANDDSHTALLNDFKGSETPAFT
jgi:integrase